LWEALPLGGEFLLRIVASERQDGKPHPNVDVAFVDPVDPEAALPRGGASVEADRISKDVHKQVRVLLPV